MLVLSKARKTIKTLLLGDTAAPEELATGIPDPQSEIAVWLHGMDQPIDVTYRQSTACSSPFRICVAFPPERVPTPTQLNRLRLKFSEREGLARLLGEIGLKWTQTLSLGELTLCVFAARSATNYCLPKRTLYPYYLRHLYRTWTNASASSHMPMSFLERRAAMVSFIRPHPTVLGSTMDDLGSNLFPMNIMGMLGDSHFGFALRDDRFASHLVERTGRLVLSNVPMPQASIAYGLAGNHTKTAVRWEELPFATQPSPLFKIPAPVFAQRIRELQVEKVHRIGSHTFFVARILRDEIYSTDPVLCVIHGYYQEWRLKGRPDDLKASLAEDAINKRGKAAS
jgi:flavin reductase (DIM6/NTAB) family NADH-FMN oxidoreductase RutF